MELKDLICECKECKTLKINMTTEEKQTQVDYLNANVWCRLGVSKIHGVGVIAIRDIPEGTALYPSCNTYFELSPWEMDELGLHPAIKKIILDRHQFSNFYWFYSPNKDAIMQSFMNHASPANSTGYHAIRDIKAGEEVTEDYTSFGNLNEELRKCV